MLGVALKEWGAVCGAILSGRQSLLLRKGGVAEDGFRLEATRFFLYPTFVHQQEAGIKDDARPLLDDAVARHRPGRVAIEGWAEVTGIYLVRDRLSAHLISHLHVMSDDAVEKRFQYRDPGLQVLAVRAYRLPAAIEIVETDEQRGCKSWVPLSPELSIEGSTPVLSDEHHRDVVVQLDTLLRPTATV